MKFKNSRTKGRKVEDWRLVSGDGGIMGVWELGRRTLGYMLYTLQTEQEGVIVSWHYHFSVVPSVGWSQICKLQLELIKLLLHLLYKSVVHIIFLYTMYILSMHGYDITQFRMKFIVFSVIRYTKNYFLIGSVPVWFGPPKHALELMDYVKCMFSPYIFTLHLMIYGGGYN